MKLLVVLFSLALALQAQTLTVGAVTGQPNSVARVPLTLSNVSPPPATLRWTLRHSRALSINPIAGPVATAASKIIDCDSVVSALVATTCVLYGINNAVMNNGIVAYLNVSIPGNFFGVTGIEIGNVVGDDPDGNPVIVNGVSGQVFVIDPTSPRSESSGIRLPVLPGRIQKSGIRGIQCPGALVEVGDELECAVRLDAPLENGRWITPFASRADLVEVVPVWVDKGEITFSYTVRLVKNPEVTELAILLTGISMEGQHIPTGVINLTPVGK